MAAEAAAAARAAPAFTAQRACVYFMVILWGAVCAWCLCVYFLVCMYILGSDALHTPDKTDGNTRTAVDVLMYTLGTHKHFRAICRQKGVRSLAYTRRTHGLTFIAAGAAHTLI